MADKLGPAFHVSRIGVSSQFGGDTFTIKAHFHDRDTAEVVRRVMLEEKLPHGPFPQQFAAQAELIDLDKLHAACIWYGYAPPTPELLGWWVGREVNRLLDLIMAAKDAAQGAAPRGVHPSSNGLGTPQPAPASPAAKWK